MFKTIQSLRVLAVLGLAAASSAYADCTAISSFPYRITASGSYCLTADVSVNSDLYNGGHGGDTITVNASNVDIDFQGYSITNTASGSSRGAGVDILNFTALHDVKVHNGALNWFDYGVVGNNFDSGVQPSNLTVDQMTIKYTKIAAIVLNGANLRVTNNIISSVLGSTLAYGIDVRCCGPAPDNLTSSNRAVVQGNTVQAVKVAGKAADGTGAHSNAFGIHASGIPDILIRDNNINGVMVQGTLALPGSKAYGIAIEQLLGLAQVGGLIVQDNSVQNNGIYFRNSKPNSAVGILIDLPSDHVIVTGATIKGMDVGIDASNGPPVGAPPPLLLNYSISALDSPTTNANGQTNAATLIPIRGGVTLPQ